MASLGFTGGNKQPTWDEYYAAQQKPALDAQKLADQQAATLREQQLADDAAARAYEQGQVAQGQQYQQSVTQDQRAYDQSEATRKNAETMRRQQEALALLGLKSPASGTSTPLPTNPTVAPGGAGGTLPPHVAPPSIGSSQAYAEALNQAQTAQSQIAQSALSGLRSALGGQGALGGSMAEPALEGMAQQGAQSLTDVNRSQLAENDQTAQQMTNLGYQGGIQERGQDITARGQDINAALNASGLQQTSQAQLQAAILDALRSQVY